MVSTSKPILQQLVLLILIGLVIAASNLAVVPLVIDGYWMPKQVIWASGSLLIGIVGLTMIFPIRSFSNWPLIIFLAYIIIQFHIQFLWHHVLTPVSDEALRGTPILLNWNFTPVIPYLTLLGSVLAIVVFSTRLTPSTWKALAVICGTITFLLTLGGWLQYFGFDFLNPHVRQPQQGTYLPLIRQPGTTYGNPMASAVALAIGSPLLLESFGRYGRYLFAATFLLILFQEGGNFSALIGTCSGVIGYLFFTRRLKLAITLSGFLIAASLFTFKSFMDLGGRLEAWNTMLHYWHTGPKWTGIGLGAIRTLALKQGWSFYPLHNDLLQLFVEVGYIGGLLFTFSLMLPISRLFQRMSGSKAAWAASGIVFGITSLTAFPSHVGGSLLYGCLAMASLNEG